MTPTPIGDHYELVVGGEAHRSKPGPRSGGEWDPWFALPRRQRRILIGARFARPDAMWPDDLADLIARNHPNLDTHPLDWYYRTSLQVLRERRAARNRDRHLRVAAESGHTTYYRRRAALATQAGYPTFWQYRKTKWHRPPDELEEAA